MYSKKFKYAHVSPPERQDNLDARQEQWIKVTFNRAKKEETRKTEKLAQLSLFNYQPGFKEMNEPQEDLCKETTFAVKRLR